jgi:hypothetical protein
MILNDPVKYLDTLHSLWGHCHFRHMEVMCFVKFIFRGQKPKLSALQHGLAQAWGHCAQTLMVEQGVQNQPRQINISRWVRKSDAASCAKSQL